MSTQTATRTRQTANDIQVYVAGAVGGVLVLVALLGFVLVPNEGLLLGIFGVNTLHHVVHLATGLLGLGAGFYSGGKLSPTYNKGHSILYMVVFAVGIGVTAVAALLNANLADHALHLVLGIALGMVGFGASD